MSASRPSYFAPFGSVFKLKTQNRRTCRCCARVAGTPDAEGRCTRCSSCKPKGASWDRNRESCPRRTGSRLGMTVRKAGAR